jgi:adenosylhomocysteine nucleosidase
MEFKTLVERAVKIRTGYAALERTKYGCSWTNEEGALGFVGDVVVATETVEHDIHNRFGKPLLPRFAGAEVALSGLRSIASPDETFQVHFGPIASGDEDIVDADTRSMLHQSTRALAVAWEGAGGARACCFSGIPFVEIRGITDEADSDAASDFEENLGGTMKNVATLIASWLGMRVAP